MDALVLDLVGSILTALSLALLAWGGWLSIGGGTARGQAKGAAERTEALFS